MHAHQDHHHDHHHSYKEFAFKRLLASLVITVVVMLVEIVGGWLSGSIALISDAGHMLTHAFAICISLFGIIIAREPRCHHRTFGLFRAEVLAAFVNGLFLILVSVWIVYESAQRFVQPTEILTSQMFLVAILGLGVNLVSIYLLEGSRQNDLNVRSVFMHMIGDAVSSIAIVIAAMVIRLTDWVWLDPVLSIGIALWIAVWALDLLKESSRVLLEMAPKGMDVHAISEAMRRRFPVIEATQQEHLWTISEEMIVFSANLRLHQSIQTLPEIKTLLHEIEHWLEDEFGIVEATLQVS